jgi:hypothetical protein
MGFRTGLVVGFAAGFYVGSWAGRERHEQINKALQRVGQSDAFDAATGKAKAVVDLGKERAKDVFEAKRGRDTGRDSGQYARVPDDAPTAEFFQTPDGEGSS